jgi:hypothetical protein
LDFFLSEFVKGIAYREDVKSVTQLHDRISRSAQCVTNEMLANTCPETEYRLDTCRATDGAHIEIC